MFHSNQGIITSVFHKKTYTGLLTNYCSFVPFSYKLGLVCTLVDRIFKIKSWFGAKDTTLIHFILYNWRWMMVHPKHVLIDLITRTSKTLCGLLRPYLTSCCYEALVIIIYLTHPQGVSFLLNYSAFKLTCF